MKLWCDASLHEQPGVGAIAVVDETGQVIATRTFTGVRSNTGLEVEALKLAVRFSKRYLPGQDIQIFTDSQAAARSFSTPPQGFTFTRIRRHENKAHDAADVAVRKALARMGLPANR